MCQLISAVRGTSPEVRQHLGTAASALMQAAAGVLDPAVPDQTSARRPEPPVEHIDLDGDADWEDD